MFSYRFAYLPVTKKFLMSLKWALFPESQPFLFAAVNTRPGFTMRVNIHNFIIWQNAVRLMLHVHRTGEFDEVTPFWMRRFVLIF